MNIENKVPNLELCKKLFELEITKNNTEWFWTQDRLTRQPELYRDRDGYEIIPAPDLAELMELLPGDLLISGKLYHSSINKIPFSTNRLKGEYHVNYNTATGFKRIGEYDATLTNAIARMLIELKQEGLT